MELRTVLVTGLSVKNNTRKLSLFIIAKPKFFECLIIQVADLSVTALSPHFPVRLCALWAPAGSCVNSIR